MELCLPYSGTVADRQTVKWVCCKTAHTGIYWCANQGCCCHLLQSGSKQAASWGFEELVPKLFHSKSSAGVNPTVWTLGYAIPYHTNQLLEKLGFVLGLNSMQGWEAKHVKLTKYVENTCNVKKSMRRWIVFRHEFVSYGLERWTLTVFPTGKRKRKVVTPTYLRGSKTMITNFVTVVFPS